MACRRSSRSPRRTPSASRRVHEVPADFVRAQLEAVFDDIGVDAAKTGMLFSEAVIVAVADFLEGLRVPLVVDPVMVASSGARLLQPDAAAALVRRLFPLATVVTPNLMEAEAIVGRSAPRRELAEALVALGAPAALVTGGHGEEAVDHLFDGREHVEIPVERPRPGDDARSGVHALGDARRPARTWIVPSGRGHRRPRASPLARLRTVSPTSVPARARSTSWGCAMPSLADLGEAGAPRGARPSRARHCDRRRRRGPRRRARRHAGRARRGRALPPRLDELPRPRLQGGGRQPERPRGRRRRAGGADRHARGAAGHGRRGRGRALRGARRDGRAGARRRHGGGGAARAVGHRDRPLGARARPRRRASRAICSS